MKLTIQKPDIVALPPSRPASTSGAGFAILPFMSKPFPVPDLEPGGVAA